MVGESYKKAELKNIEKLKEEARRCGYHPGDIAQLENYQEDSQEYENYLSRLKEEEVKDCVYDTEALSAALKRVRNKKLIKKQEIPQFKNLTDMYNDIGGNHEEYQENKMSRLCQIMKRVHRAFCSKNGELVITRRFIDHRIDLDRVYSDQNHQLKCKICAYVQPFYKDRKTEWSKVSNWFDEPQWLKTIMDLYNKLYLPVGGEIGGHTKMHFMFPYRLLNNTANEYEYNSVLGRLMLQYAEYQLRLINEEYESNLILLIFLMEVYQEVENPDMDMWGKAGEEYLHNWSNLPEEKEPSEPDSTHFSSDETSTDDDEREDESHESCRCQNRSNNDRCCPDGTRSTES